MRTEIAEKIEQIIKIEVSKLREEDEKYKNNWFDLKGNIEVDIENTKDYINDLKKEGLTLNALEHEGYLRCLKSLKEYIKELK